MEPMKLLKSHAGFLDVTFMRFFGERLIILSNAQLNLRPRWVLKTTNLGWLFPVSFGHVPLC